MPSYRLQGMFEGDFADMCFNRFLLMSMGDRAPLGLAFADPGGRTSIAVWGNYHTPPPPQSHYK